MSDIEHIYKVQRIEDGKFYGRKPRFHKGRFYFGPKGKVYTRKVDAVAQRDELNEAGIPAVVLEYDVVYGRAIR